MKFRILTYLCLTLLGAMQASAQQAVSLHATSKLQNIGKWTHYFQDAQFLSIENVLQPSVQAQFRAYSQADAHFGSTSDAVWLRFDLKKVTEGDFYLQLGTAFIDSLALYAVTDGKIQEVQISGDNYPFSQRAVKVTTFLFPLKIPLGGTQTYFLRSKTMQPFYFPLRTGTLQAFMEDTHLLDFLQGIYLGFMLVMIFYNLFLYFSTRDRLYLLYVAYVCSMSWFMSTVYQYIFEYAWPHFPTINQYAIVSSGVMMLTATLFTQHFLNTKEQSPKLHQFSKIFIGLSILIFILVIPGQFIPALIIGQAGILFMAIFFLYAGIATFRQGYPPAKYYLVAWSFLILGIIVEILATVNLSPNLYYTNTMQLGSAFEVALLSFALADRINLYKKQREKSQQALVAQTQENERIVREQNVFLEHKVQERTGELNVSLETLRNTQMKLVENEKMASLGVLTAGIAHEINNPINFIASSLNPLKRNLETLSELLDKYDAISQTHEAYPSIEAFKEEIDYEYTCEETNLLLTSISEGAERTTAIVKGLRNFSRLDEGERKKVDLNEGLESTLMLLQSNIRQKYIETVSSFGPLPETLCFPGQLNQVFMNVLTNAIQAMSNKGILTVQSEFDPTLEQIRIRVSDTGKGMSEAVMQKIFDPFFTTKAVGEGTGLGLSISYGIIQKHQGTIKVESEVGKGSTFWIVLPVQH